MRLLTSSLYTLLLYVIPGELLLVALSQILPIPVWLGLVIFNLAAYMVIYLSLRLGGVVFDDLASATDGLSKHLHAALEGRGLRWLGLAGTAVVGAGAIVLALAGQLPLPFWFLFAAILVGLTEHFKAVTTSQPSASLPTPRFDLASLEPVTTGQAVIFTWSCPVQPRDGSSMVITQSFLFTEAEIPEPAGVPALPAEQRLPRYVLTRFEASLQQVAAWFRGYSEHQKLDALGECAHVIAFARSLVRASTSPATDESSRWLYPLESLLHGAAAPGSAALLAACLLHWLGHSVALHVTPIEGAEHLSLACPLAVPGAARLDELPSSMAEDEHGSRYFICAVGPALGQRSSPADQGSRAGRIILIS